MSWRDFFYFSKGERMALIILLCLITIAGIILIVTDSPKPEPTAETTELPPTSVRQDSTEAMATPQPADTATTSTPKQKKETVSERVNRLTSSRPGYARAEKFATGTIVELNSADTTTLKKVPGIGSAFASRIVKYRNLLGGFYSVTQLGEVYGIDEERYTNLSPWFTVDASFIQQLDVNTLSQDLLRKHPYINYQQAKAIHQTRQQKKRLTGWENLQLLNEFTEHDKARLQYYLKFE